MFAIARVLPSIVRDSLKRGRFLARGRVLAVALALGSVTALGSPLTDLRSPSQETRDAAAKTLSETYAPLTREQLAPLLKVLRIGDRMSSVLERLDSIGAKQEKKKNDDGRTASFWYRLDPTWVLQCTFSAGALFDTTLIEDVQHVWVSPAEDFTGIWTAYYANGKPWQTVEYDDGAPAGKWTTFHSDGSLRMIQHFGKLGLEGEEIGYFRNGSVEHKGSYKDGTPVGTWIWYNEDGTVHEKTEM